MATFLAMSVGHMPVSRIAMAFIVLAAVTVAPHVALAATGQDYDKMYGDCVHDMGPISNAVVEACSGAASDAAKKEMNALYQRMHDRLEVERPEDADKLEKSQKAWVAYRNSQCELAANYVGSPMYGYCPMKLNIARVWELRELVGVE